MADMLPKAQWTPTMAEIDRLASLPLFRSGDVMEFAGLNKDAFQSWFKRGKLKDPAAGGPGFVRLWTLKDVVAIAAGRYIGYRALRQELEGAIDLGFRIAGYCLGRWMDHAYKLDQIAASEPEPLAALKSLIVHLQSESPDSVDFLILTETQTKGASPYTSLGDVWAVLKEPFFVALEMRAPLLQHFCPVALRLFQRIADEDNPEVRELEAMFAK